MNGSSHAAPRRARMLPRVLAGVIAFLALGGPSPGHVGSCDGSGELADAAMFCEAYRTYYCARELSGGRLPQDQYLQCTMRTGPGGPYTFCSGFNFTPGCEPSQRSADQCIRALDTADVAVRTDDVAQCDFCGGV
ncbi:MAG: hypothetical protein J0L92_33685 [Deltaproteobacteria bacterium]|nr:hypothetical protein [Deltaproteobacteria bacterium]